MPNFLIETHIAAPPERCFYLLRDPRLHTGHVEVDGELGVGQRVVFGRGLFATTMAVGEHDPPHRLVDVMVSGPFRSFVHVHEFDTAGEGTLMRDTLEWEMPFGIAGCVVDRIFLERHLRRLVAGRNMRLKHLAEGGG